MSKEFIDSRIDAAHDLLDQGNYEAAVNILKSIKIRVHDENVEKIISDFETKKDKESNEKLNQIEQVFTDAIEKYGDGSNIARKHAVSYLNFYDKLRKENDIY